MSAPRGLTARQERALAALRAEAVDGVLRASVARLGEILGVGSRQASRALGELAAANAIAVAPTGVGRGFVNEIRFMEAGQRSTTAPQEAGQKQDNETGKHDTEAGQKQDKSTTEAGQMSPFPSRAVSRNDEEEEKKSSSLILSRFETHAREAQEAGHKQDIETLARETKEQIQALTTRLDALTVLVARHAASIEALLQTRPRAEGQRSIAAGFVESPEDKRRLDVAVEEKRKQLDDDFRAKNDDRPMNANATFVHNMRLDLRAALLGGDDGEIKALEKDARWRAERKQREAEEKAEREKRHAAGWAQLQREYDYEKIHGPGTYPQPTLAEIRAKNPNYLADLCARKVQV